MSGSGHYTRRGLIRVAIDPGDVKMLGRLVAVEQVVAFAYAHVASSGLLRPATAATLSVFLGHEQQHVQELSRALARRGSGAPAPPKDVSVADRALATLHVGTRLGRMHSERDAIQLLIGAEAGSIGAYYLAQAKLLDGSLLQLAAQAMAADAQHATALRRLLHPRSVAKYVPNPFVEGRH